MNLNEFTEIATKIQTQIDDALTDYITPIATAVLTATTVVQRGKLSAVGLKPSQGENAKKTIIMVRGVVLKYVSVVSAALNAVIAVQCLYEISRTKYSDELTFSFIEPMLRDKLETYLSGISFSSNIGALGQFYSRVKDEVSDFLIDYVMEIVENAFK